MHPASPAPEGQFPCPAHALHKSLLASCHAQLVAAAHNKSAVQAKEILLELPSTEMKGQNSRSGAAPGAGAAGADHRTAAPLRHSSATAAPSVATALSPFFMVATYCRSGLIRQRTGGAMSAAALAARILHYGRLAALPCRRHQPMTQRHHTDVNSPTFQTEDSEESASGWTQLCKAFQLGQGWENKADLARGSAPVLAQRRAHERVGPNLQQQHVLGDLGAGQAELHAARVAVRLRNAHGQG